MSFIFKFFTHQFEIVNTKNIDILSDSPTAINEMLIGGIDQEPVVVVADQFETETNNKYLNDVAIIQQIERIKFILLE